MKISDLQIQNDGEIHEDPDAPGAAAPVKTELPELDDAGALVAHHAELPADFPVNAKRQADGSFVLTLEYPVTLKYRTGPEVRSEVTKVLTLHRLKGKHQREIRAAGAEDVTDKMLACSTGLTPGKMQLLHDAMDAADIAAALRVVRFFSTPGRRTGL